MSYLQYSAETLCSEEDASGMTTAGTVQWSCYWKFPMDIPLTILLPERNPLLFYSQRGILYYSTPREESSLELPNGISPL